MKTPASASAIWATVVLFAGPAFAQDAAERGWWFSHGGWGHMAFGGTMMIVFWGGIILIAILLARGIGGTGFRNMSSPQRQSALEILQERFAKGEIDQKEFEERRQVLSAKH